MKGKREMIIFIPFVLKILKLRENIKIIDLINGNMKKKVLKCEENSRKFARRSLYTLGLIKKGENFNKNIIPKRPELISPIKIKRF